MDDIELPDAPASPESFNGLVDEKVLAPWGEAGPAPSDHWRQDVLGADYESRTIPLMDDDAGPVVATLVRYRGHAPLTPTSSPSAPALSPAPTTSPTDAHSTSSETTPQPPRFVLLYIHGRNDYFFQRELAEDIAGCGGAFYALDLRRYGRSLRPGQRMGFVSNLSLYDEDISEALDLIREDYPDLPLVLMGHSTGGLLATLRANRHPGALEGLNCRPWLRCVQLLHQSSNESLHAIPCGRCPEEMAPTTTAVPCVRGGMLLTFLFPILLPLIRMILRSRAGVTPSSGSAPAHTRPMRRGLRPSWMVTKTSRAQYTWTSLCFQ